MEIIRKENKVFSFVGSGGKTTLAQNLASFFNEKEERVLLTTTTKIFSPDRKQVPVVLQAETEEFFKTLQKAFSCSSQVYAGEDEKEGKILGIKPCQIKKILNQNLADRIIVEADGARGLPFKFPRLNEPVLPDPPGVIFLVVGVWALGKPLGPENCHRWEHVEKNLKWKPGSVIEGERLWQLLNHPLSYSRLWDKNSMVLVLCGVGDRWQKKQCSFLARKPEVRKVFSEVIMVPEGSKTILDWKNIL